MTFIIGKVFTGKVVKSGRFWVITVTQEPHGAVAVTQSYRWRGRRKAQSMANECAALLLDVPVKDVWVNMIWLD